MTKLYIIQQKGTNTIKIGISDNVRRRVRELQTGSPHKLVVVRTLNCPDRDTAERLEKLSHRRYAKYRLEGEWFNLPPQKVVNDLNWGLQFAKTAGYAKNIELDQSSKKSRKHSKTSLRITLVIVILLALLFEVFIKQNPVRAYGGILYYLHSLSEILRLVCYPFLGLAFLAMIGNISKGR
jgi:predicted GIY-YIG superfamily endonuclease